jgi:hypothetical protein
MFLRTLGPNHPKCQAFIKAEDRKVQRYNDAARRLNEVSGQHLISYKRNRYTVVCRYHLEEINRNGRN